MPEIQDLLMDNAKKDYDKIKQQLNKIEQKHRQEHTISKTIDNVAAVVSYPFSGATKKSSLSVFGNTIIGLLLAAACYYIGIGWFANFLMYAMGYVSFTVPVGAALLADYEVNNAKFPKLDQKRAFLARKDLNLIDLVFLAEMDQDMGYDPVKKVYIDPNAKLLIENDTLFKSAYDNAMKKVNEYIDFAAKTAEELANEKFLNGFNSQRSLFEEILFAAGKTLMGLIFMTGTILLLFLSALGLTGPIVLFAMSPALSVGLIGAIIIAGLKFLYPDPKRTTIGFLVDVAVKVIFAPISLLGSGVEILSRPIMAFYNKVQIFKLERALDVMDLPDNELSVDFATLHQADPELLPILIRYFKAEQQLIKDKIAVALSGDTNVDLKQIAKDLALLEACWVIFKSKGNRPFNFAMNSEGFLQQYYQVARDRYEATAKKRVSVPPSVKEQQDLNDLKFLKHHCTRLRKSLSP